jgi:hypothetical protein
MGDIMKEKKNIPEIRFEGFVGEWEDKKLVDIGYTYSDSYLVARKTDLGHDKEDIQLAINVFSNTIVSRRKQRSN